MDHGDREELRLALALNGGVSLAVWIGGVVHEVNRMRTGAGVWGEALELFGTDVRVDVIAGASAGGINGGFLAVAMIYGSDLTQLRNLWVDKGALLTLMRDPLSSPMPSLLRGDEYFLPALRAAYRSLAAGGRPASPAEVPVHLTMTTTLLVGKAGHRPDDFGSVITDVSHADAFTFVRGPDVAADHFTQPDSVDKLALASRSTASFPGAFEPSFCPVGPSPDDPDRIDMAAHVGFKQSRFVVDGGVLVNKPLGPALDAIFGQRADRQVRRVLAYVVPDPSPPTDPGVSRAAEPPTPLSVISDSLVNLPRVESLAKSLDFYRRHNEEVRKRRGSRDALVATVGTDLGDLAATVFPAYRAARVQSSSLFIVGEVVAGLAARAGGEFVRWDREQLVDELFRADLPWVPVPPPSDGNWFAEAFPWRWGMFPVQRMTGILLDLIRRAIYLAPFGSSARADLGRLRGELHDIAAALHAGRVSEDWRQAVPDAAELVVLQRDADPAAAVTAAIVEACLALVRSRPPTDVWGVAGLRVAGLFGELGELISGLPGGRSRLPEAASPLGMGEREVLQAWARLAGAGTRSRSRSPVDDVERLRRLLALEVLETAFGQNQISVDQFIELVQVSADTECPLDDARSTAAAKLAGVQLGHFGAFYKRSWRSNDWMWGRIDGVTKLVKVLLDPRRLRQLVAQGAVTQDDLELVLFGPPGLDHDWLVAQVAQADIDREFAMAASKGAPLPEVLPRCSEALARRIQLETLRDELPVVAASVRYDRADGALPQGLGEEWTRIWDRETTGRDRTATGLPAAALVELFRACDVGTERLVDDSGSDLFTATASKALAGTVSVVYDKRSGLGPLRAAAATARSPVMLLWLMARNATSESSSGPVLNALLLGIGGTLVAVSLFLAGGLPGWLVGLGWVAVAAGLLLAAVRSVWLVAGAAVAAALALGLWVVVGGRPMPLASSGAELPRVVSAALGVTLLVVLGTVREPSAVRSLRAKLHARRNPPAGG